MCVGLPGQRVEGGGRGGDQEGCQAQGRREHVGHSRRKSSGIDCKSGEDPIRLKTPEPTLNRNEKKNNYILVRHKIIEMYENIHECIKILKIYI